MNVDVIFDCGCIETVTDADEVLVELHAADPDLPVELDEPCFSCGAAAWRALHQKARGAAL